MSPLSPLTHARNIGHTHAKGTSSAGCAVKTIQTACRSSRVYVNVGANNNSNNPFQRLRRPETRKMQGFQAWLLEKGALTCKFYDFRGFAGFHQFRRLQRNWGLIFCYASDGQKRGKSNVFKGWLLEKDTFTCKFDDIRGFAGLHQFRRLQRITGARFFVTKFCLSNALCTLGRGWISGFPHFNGQKKHRKSKVVQGKMSIHRQIR